MKEIIRKRFNREKLENNSNIQLLNIMAEVLEEHMVYYNEIELKNLFKEIKPKRMHWPSDKDFKECALNLE